MQGSQPLRVVAFDHVVLKVADQERSLAFYCGELGLAPARVDEWRRGEAPFPSARVDEETILDIVPGARDGENVEHFCLVIAPTDLDALKASGRFEVVDGPATRWGARGNATSLYVLDPDGNTVELRYYAAAPALLTGERVVLRAVRDDDVDRLEKMFAEAEVARWWPGYDRARVENEMLRRVDAKTTVYAIAVDDEVAGVVQSSEEDDPEYRRAGIDIAVATRWHGTGVAVDALHTLARHLIDDRGHHHLTIDPAADNARAIGCYAKVGFRPVGVLRRNERGADGTFHDTLLMDLLASELR